MPQRVRAFAIRGLLGQIYSRGMNTLAATLNAISGVACSVEDHGSSFWWFSNVDRLTDACVAAHGSGRAIVLIGHSFGGNAALRIATRLNAMQPAIRVALIAPIDPAAQNTLDVAPNCERVLAYYQKVDPVGRGIVIPAAGWTDAAWRERVAVVRRDEAHIAADDDQLIHREIAAAVAALTMQSA